MCLQLPVPRAAVGCRKVQRAVHDRTDRQFLLKDRKRSSSIRCPIASRSDLCDATNCCLSLRLPNGSEMTMARMRRSRMVAMIVSTVSTTSLRQRPESKINNTTVAKTIVAAVVCNTSGDKEPRLGTDLSLAACARTCWAIASFSIRALMNRWNDIVGDMLVVIESINSTYVSEKLREMAPGFYSNC